MMHLAIVEDCVFDQKHLITLIQKNFENHGEIADFTCYESGEAFLAAFHPGLFNAVFMNFDNIIIFIDCNHAEMQHISQSTTVFF